MPRDWPGSPGGTPGAVGRTELWIAGITEQGTLVDATRVAGGDAESIYQPGWTPDGQRTRQRSRRLVEALSTGQDVVSRRRERAAWRRVRQAAVGVRHGLVGSGGRGAPACFVYQCRALAPWSARYDERCA